MAYTNDLVRLATSARLSISAREPGAHAASGVQRHPRGIPHVARARRAAVRPRRGAPRAATRRDQSELRDPVRFWTAMADLPPARKPPRGAGRAPAPASSATGTIRASSPGARGSAASATRASWRSPSTTAAGSLERRRSSSRPGSRGRRRSSGTASRSTIRRSSGERCAAPIRSSRSAAAGCSAGLPPTAAGSSSRLRACRWSRRDLLTAMGAETANVHIGSGPRRIAAVSR